jgi:hypothetical protein
MPDTREDCFPDDQRTQNWTTYYGGGTDYNMAVRICELCGALVRLGYLHRHAAFHQSVESLVARFASLDESAARFYDATAIDPDAILIGLRTGAQSLRGRPA